MAFVHAISTKYAPNACALPAGGRGRSQRHFDGTNFKSQKLLENAPDSHQSGRTGSDLRNGTECTLCWAERINHADHGWRQEPLVFE